MKQPRLKDSILLFLEKHPSASIKKVQEQVRTMKGETPSYDVVSVYLRRMTQKELIKNVSYGRYSIAEKGFDLLKQKRDYLKEAINEDLKPQQELKLPAVNINSSSIIENIDLESIDAILKLKQKYGRERLLKIIDKIRQVIE